MPAEGMKVNQTKWKTYELRDWLGGGSEWHNAPRDKLIREVTARLDSLYATFTPRYPNVTDKVHFTQLLPWDPIDESSWATATQSFPFRGLIREAGPLERCFNASFSLSEAMSNVGATLPMGRHPLDDFRQNQLLIAQACDDKTRDVVNIIMQDIHQTEALAIRVLGIQFLPPGQKLRSGTKVVCHNLHTEASLQCLNGVVGTITAKQPECKYTLKVPAITDDSASGNEGTTEVTLPAHCLLPMHQQGEHNACGSSDNKVRPFTAGTVVVVAGLQRRPDLNGRLGHVVKDASNTAAAESNDRYDIRLVKTNAAEEARISAKAVNLVEVQKPPPAVLVAYASHNTKRANSRKVDAFMNSQMRHLLPVQNIRCTLREILFMKRCIDDNAKKLPPLSSKEKAQLLGPLNPRMWELSVLMVASPPLTQVEQAAKDLKGSRACRQCGKGESKECKLLWCGRCSGVCYCSATCQKADWKARHKLECTASATAQQQAAGGTEVGSPVTAGATAADESSLGKSVLLPLDARKPSESGNSMLWVNCAQGTICTDGAVPINQYGDSTFLVKVQNSFNPMATLFALPDSDEFFKGDLFVYEKARTIQFYVYKEQCPAEHAALVARLRKDGQRGKLDPAGRKVYLRARREGKYLRVFVGGELPEQLQPW